jgi:hypothetical protein
VLYRINGFIFTAAADVFFFLFFSVILWLRLLSIKLQLIMRLLFLLFNSTLKIIQKL